MLSGRELGQAAYEAWGRYGVPVFPCGDDKRPLLKWRDRAVTGEQECVELFEAYGSRARLIGACMGIQANLFALDFDLYKGAKAQEYLQTLLAGGMLPSTRVHTTRSGGLHYLYSVQHEKDMPRNSVPTDGVEIRGEGGFIIVPPSHGYAVQQDEEIPDAPASLLKRLSRAEAAFKALSPSALKEQIINGESFHEALTSLAAKLNAQGLEPSEVMAQMTSAMNASVASNPSHVRHDRWKKIMEGEDGELARLSGSAYRKFNPTREDDDVKQIKGPMGAAMRNRAATLRGLFVPPPGDTEVPKGAAFGKPAVTTESVTAPDEFPFGRSYTAAKVQEEDNKTFLIYPLVMEGDVVVLSAAPKAGKTLTTMNLCLHAAAGQPIGDQLIPMNREGKTAPVPVIYFALEGQGAIRKRVKAWIEEQKKKGFHYKPDDLRIYIVEQALNLADEASKQDTVDKLVRANAFFQQKGWGNIGMVVFDTLTKAMPGKDQNSVEDTSAVFATVDMMREVGLSAAVFFIHHNNKTGGAPRGSGNIMAEPDTVLSVNKIDQIVDNGVYKDCYQLSVYMARAVDDSQVYKFSAQSVEIGVNSQGIMENAPVLEVLDSYTVAPTKAENTIKQAADAARSKFYDIVWHALSDAPSGTMTLSALHRTVSKGNPAVSAFYGQYMNGNNKEAAKAAWTALLHTDRLPTSMNGMSFAVTDTDVTMKLDLTATG